MNSKAMAFVKAYLLDLPLALGCLAFLFVGLVTPLFFRAFFGVGEIWAFVLSSVIFAVLCLLAVVRQRRFIDGETAAPQFVSISVILWRRGLTLVVVSGLLLVGTVLHGVFVSTGLLCTR